MSVHKHFPNMSRECLLCPIHYLFLAPHISVPIDSSDSDKTIITPSYLSHSLYHYYCLPQGAQNEGMETEKKEGSKLGGQVEPGSVKVKLSPFLEPLCMSDV